MGNVRQKRFSWDDDIDVSVKNTSEKVHYLADRFFAPIQQSKSKKIVQELERLPNNARGADRTFIYHLRQVYLHPQLEEDATELSDKAEEFASWLETCMMSRWGNLSEISVVADIELERYRYSKNVWEHC